MVKRKISVVITARPSYSRIKTALQAIQAHPDLELYVVVAGSALLERYGSAARIIEQDGFPIAAKVFNMLEGENLSAAAKTTGIGILELSTVFNQIQPDLVLTIADRYETMATAIAASYMNIPLVHIQGGEVTGNIDEKVRHAITKLADYHFVASEDARERVIRLGEAPERVFNTGCPSIDLAAEVLKHPVLDVDLYEKYGGVGARPSYNDDYAIVMQHPVTTEHTAARAQVEETLYALLDVPLHVFWFWPNGDAGADGTSTGIRAFRERHALPHVHFFKNLEPHDFLRLLYHARVLVGNSSVGIREGAYLGVPVVNIGNRQHRRERGTNTLDVSYNRIEIQKGIAYWLEQPRPSSSAVYGTGDAGKKMAGLLADLPLVFHKTITY